MADRPAKRARVGAASPQGAPPPRAGPLQNGGAPGKGDDSSKLIVNPEDTFTVCGMRGTGKTTLEMELARLTKTVVMDPLAQFDPKIRWVPPRHGRRELDWIAAKCWQASPVRLIVSEAEQLVPEGRPLPPVFGKFALMGRNLGSSWGMDTRRPQKLTKELLDNSDHIFIFKLSGRAIRYMVDYISEDADDENDAKQLFEMRAWTKDPRQGGGWFFHYHDGRLVKRKPLKIAKPTASASSPRGSA